MLGAWCGRYGGAEIIELRELPEPTPSRGQVVVQISASSLNYPDLLFLANAYQSSRTLPFIAGSEFAGTVMEVGADVTGWAVGDRVMGTAPEGGAWAQRIAIDAERLRSVPDALTMEEAAVFDVVYETAFHALVTAGSLRAGENVIVLGGSGGVGLATVDVAQRLGATVTAVGSSRSGLAATRALGATVLDASPVDSFKDRLRALTGGGDLVVDPVGGALAEQALRALRPGGRFVVVGFASGAIPRIPLNLVLLKDVSIHGIDLGRLQRERRDVIDEGRRVLARLVQQGLRPTVTRRVPLRDVASAVAAMAERRAGGKTVIVMDGF
jgi:NADPH2:quinone reductase